MKSSTPPNPNAVLPLLILAVVMCGCANSDKQKSRQASITNVNANQVTPPTPSPSISPTSVSPAIEPPTDPKYSSEYQAGYKHGYKEGRSWAKEVVSGGMPTDQGIRMMASHQASESGSKDQDAWEDGWADGFGDGYQGIKPPKINSSSLQPVSLANARPGVKLYDHEGNYQVTITSVNEVEGTITVKYPPSRAGVIEDKSVDALASFWFVKTK